ncbi:peptide-methionine (S)-S-oxide reductase MsrA [Sphingosinicella sp.]|uniref:peptide-methionine (S)-S-oxide reductase MsrA n=1 Tax=Sphingosinicella sp. TaxID=1917971 RepID=UPI004038238A
MTLRTAFAVLIAAALASASVAQGSRTERAIFAGGCFWSTENDMEHVPGVSSAVSGFTGGTVANPTYEQTSAGGTGHVEAVVVVFDPARISYAQLVRRFLRTIDPTDDGGQFCDRGPVYRTAIFAIGDAQRREALAAVAEANRQLGGRVVTPVRAASRFYGAALNHQDYARRNPERYAAYRRGCGRDAALRRVWGG